MRRALLSGLAVLVAVVVLPACSKADKDERFVRAAIHRTEAKTGRFIYSDERTDQSIGVTGFLEDDFRYKAQVVMNGQPSYDEVVNDDAVAVRLLDANVLERLQRKDSGDAAGSGSSAAAASPAVTDVAGLNVVDALRTHRWVVDPANAPSPLDTARVPTATDPVLDARTTLAYVERSIDEGYAVKRWQADALQPVYPSSEDKFPQPSKGSGVDRYDVVRPFLPAASSLASAGGGGSQTLPQTKQFRKMAIYIKDGLVIRVIERTEAIGKQVSELTTYMRALLKETHRTDQEKAAFEQLVRTTPTDELGAKLISLVSELLRNDGLPVVNARIMSFELVDIGRSLKLELPTENVVHGNLLLLAPVGSTKPGATPSA